MKISIKRAYDDPGPHDGHRVLVDRVWPRGLTKNALAIDEWAKELAPSAELRKWFGHDPQRWDAFQKRYREELSDKRDRLGELLKAAGKRPLTLVYGAKDKEHNQAVVLRSILSQMSRGR